jgi:choline monooxygenase
VHSARGLETSEGFDAARFHLTPVRVDVLADKLVFFNLDPDAAPLEQFTAGLEQEWRSEIPDFDQLVRVERPASTDGRLPTSGTIIKANWKIVVDNCLECYHCRPVHPAFRQLLAMDDFRVRSHDYWASLKGHLQNPNAVPDTARNKNYRFWWLWPNTFLEMAPGGAHGFTVGSQMPIDISRTTQGKNDRFGVPGGPLFEPRGYGDLNLVAEDRGAMESVQRGVASLGYGAGCFSFNANHGETSEEAVHRFQWLVAKPLDP